MYCVRNKQQYEKGETPEARVVGQIDKFDMYLQAHEYEACTRPATTTATLSIPPVFT
jgi:5'-deoxynucleotidase YfbR-like HD superfamily hydrolase